LTHHVTLVLDQASVNTGFAVVEADPSHPVAYGVTGRLLTSGVIRMKGPTTSLMDRLNVLRTDLVTLMTQFRPTELVIEHTTPIRRSGDTTNVMGAVSALCKDFAKTYGLAFYAVSPTSIKARIAANGSASKDEVRAAVQTVWNMKGSKIVDDNHADALAAAFVWLMSGDEYRKAAALKREARRRVL
jgi:Holliday junction resolvasome RuvABC endonuclease subunit